MLAINKKTKLLPECLTSVPEFDSRSPFVINHKPAHFFLDYSIIDSFPRKSYTYRKINHSLKYFFL